MAKYDLSLISTEAPVDVDKDTIKDRTDLIVEELSELQTLMYAESKKSLLIVLQGMDASGKDGAVRKVFSAVNPQGVRVYSFKKPTEEELRHDFLWRIHKQTPEHGIIQIFNRSHYEDVLVTRVLGLIDEKTAQRRYEYINAFERTLTGQNTIILKFYLHISRKEQEERFQERMTDPTKYWKYNPEDAKTAKDWDKYMAIYPEVFEKCSSDIPWTIVPADNKWYRDFLISNKIVETLKSLKMKYPELRK